MSQDYGQPGRASSKRAAEEPGQKPTRSKRSRYVNKACNECKRRKLKCDGDEPCERCMLQDTACVYGTTSSHPGPDWSDIHTISLEIEAMRSNLDQVIKELKTTKSLDEQQVNTSAYSGPISAPQRPLEAVEGDKEEEINQSHSTDSSPCRGPTSSGFAFDMARERLRTLGLAALETESLSRRDELDFASFTPYRMLDLTNIRALLERDPLWQMHRQEVNRLIDVWDNGIGKLFPMIDVEKLHAWWESLHAKLTSAKTSGNKQEYLTTIEALSDGETHILKLVLSNCLTAGSGGANDTAKALFDSTGGAPQAAITERPTLENIHILMLVGILYYHLDDEMRANRVVSLAVRLCFEMGLHRTETFQRSIKEDDRATAVATFWSVYVLERRSSIGLGVPFIIQDSEIDPSLPRPSQHLYLEAMVGLTKLAGQICRRTSTLRDRSIAFPAEEIDYQDYQVLQWQKQLCTDLTLDISGLRQDQQSQLEMSTSTSTYLAVVLHARAQQLRGLIYRPVLYSAARIAENKRHAQIAVDIARESVQFLALTSRATTLALDEPLFFRDFLMSHLAGILLAVSNAPTDFSHQLCNEFYLVLDVLRKLSSRSPVIARVWNSIRILEVAGAKLGLNRPQNMQSSRISSTSNDYIHLTNSHEGQGVVHTESDPILPMHLIWTSNQQDVVQSTFNSRDLASSTFMFPTQLRNELSMMDEPLGDLALSLLDYDLTNDFNTSTCWQT